MINDDYDYDGGGAGACVHIKLSQIFPQQQSRDDDGRHDMVTWPLDPNERKYLIVNY